MDPVSWAGSANLEAPAAALLRRLAAALPQTREFAVTVFGSAPIQIMIDSSLTSADVNVFSDFEHLGEVVEQAGLSENKSPFYIQVSSELNFRTSPRWKDRTQRTRIGQCLFCISSSHRHSDRQTESAGRERSARIRSRNCQNRASH